MFMFNFFKKSKKISESQQDVHLSMVMLNDPSTFDFIELFRRLETEWRVYMRDRHYTDDSCAFTADGMTVTIMKVDAPIPQHDVHEAAQVAYWWPDAAEQSEHHKGHLIVGILPSSKKQINRYSLLSKIIESVLVTSDAIGAYAGGQSLLIQKDIYVESMRRFKVEGVLPANLWFYVGLRQADTGNSGYTYGLNYFQKLEMEIIDSRLDLAEIYGILLNTCSYIVLNDITLKNGQTLGFTVDEEITLSISKAMFNDGITVKLNV